MLRKRAGTSVELPSALHCKYLEPQQHEIVREICQSLHRSSLSQFTYAFVDARCRDLNAVVYELDGLREASFRDLIEVIGGLGDARHELRLARFLFDVEEINPVYRLILRNRALLRTEKILDKVLSVWPLYNSSHD
jgi:hypothetical protein